MAEKVSVQPISVLKPDAGESSEIRMQTHRVYSLAFYPDSVSFEQQGDDMGILFDDAARIVLHDFFVVARSGDFTLELPDGVQLQGKDVAEAMMMSLQDFHTDSPALAGAPADDGRAHAPRESSASGPAVLLNEDGLPDALRATLVREAPHSFLRFEDLLDSGESDLFVHAADSQGGSLFDGLSPELLSQTPLPADRWIDAQWPDTAADSADQWLLAFLHMVSQ